MSDTTSLSLLDRAIKSEGDASREELLYLYTPLLQRWLGRYNVGAADADDLVQEVLMVVVKELPAFRHNQRTGAFRSWLRRILVHRVRAHWRSRDQRPGAPGGSEFAQQLQELEDDSSGVSQLWNREHDEAVIKQLVEAVKPQFEHKTWTAFRRQVILGDKADQVARELGLSVASVYMAKSRVLSALRRESQCLVDEF